MKKQTVITTKSRLDVIDTTWQKEQERRVLRWLLMLFFFTAFYEFGDPLLQQWAVEGIVVPEVPPETEKIVFPARRVDRLVQIIERTTRQHAFLRDQLKGFQNEIAAFHDPLTINPRDLKAQARLKEILGRLWEFTHISYGPDPVVYADINGESERSVKLLRGTLSEKAGLPVLDFQPKTLGNLDPVSRDPFKFSLNPLPPIGESGK